MRLGSCDYVVMTTDSSVATTKIAVQEILSSGFQPTWLATRETYTDRFRQTRTIESSLFPGYFFVMLDLFVDNWRPITQLRGVKRILGADPTHPTALRPGAVERLRAQFDAGEYLPRPDVTIVAGEPLRFTAGPYAGKIGVCKLSRGERIEILLQAFGGEVTVKTGRGMVRRAVA